MPINTNTLNPDSPTSDKWVKLAGERGCWGDCGALTDIDMDRVLITAMTAGD
jgi:hypothetical protein